MKSSLKAPKSDSNDVDSQNQVPGPDCLNIEQYDEDEYWLDLEQEVEDDTPLNEVEVSPICGWVEFTPFERDLLIRYVSRWEWAADDLEEFRSALRGHPESSLLTHDILAFELQQSGMGDAELEDEQPLHSIATRTLAPPVNSSLLNRSETMEQMNSALLHSILREEQKCRVVAWTLKRLGVNANAGEVLERLAEIGPLTTATFPQLASDLTQGEPRLCGDPTGAGALRSQDAILADRSLTAMQRMARIAPFHWGKYSWAKPTEFSPFGQWLQGKRVNPPDATSEMNCWEAILMLAFYAEIEVPRGAGLTNSEHVATQLFGLSDAPYLEPDGDGWYPALEEGQIVFLGNESDGDTFHVALALGTQDERGYQEIYSLWTDIGGQTGISTLEDSVMGQTPRQKKIDWIKIGRLQVPQPEGL